MNLGGADTVSRDRPTTLWLPGDTVRLSQKNKTKKQHLMFNRRVDKLQLQVTSNNDNKGTRDTGIMLRLLNKRIQLKKDRNNRI